jgi:hypothetical protein
LRPQKALYGILQAPRVWSAKLDDTLIALGLKRTSSEHVVYIRDTGSDRLLLGVYVDNLVITGACVTAICSFNKEMMT